MRPNGGGNRAAANKLCKEKRPIGGSGSPLCYASGGVAGTVDCEDDLRSQTMFSIEVAVFQARKPVTNDHIAVPTAQIKKMACQVAFGIPKVS